MMLMQLLVLLVLLFRVSIWVWLCLKKLIDVVLLQLLVANLLEKVNRLNWSEPLQEDSLFFEIVSVVKWSLRGKQNAQRC